MKSLAAMLAGVLFGLGLGISRMIDPNKVLAFLDVGGNWDPSLALVLAGAVTVSAIGYRLAIARGQPVFAPAFQLPSKSDIDARLVGGAAVFGIGWGLAGYCPGPAVAAMVLGNLEPFIFLAALAIGSTAHYLLERARP